MLRHLKWIIPVAIVLAAVLWIGGCVFGYMGCGHIELEIELQVLDAETGTPIGGAEIEITSWDGFPHEDVHREEPTVVTLQTDAEGIVRIDAGKRFADMSGDAWGLWTQVRVRLPAWRYKVSAEGYRSPEWIVGFRPERLPQEHTDHGMKQVIRWRLVPEPAD